MFVNKLIKFSARSLKENILVKNFIKMSNISIDTRVKLNNGVEMPLFGLGLFNFHVHVDAIK